MTAQRFVERAEKARDLRDQMDEALGPEEDSEFQFYEWSPGRTNVSLWSTETGEEIVVPRYIAEAALFSRNEDGEYRFTADPSKAPEPRVNDVKCFMHRDAPERPFLVEAGIIGAHERGCEAAHLANDTSKWTHARNRHQSRYQQYREELDRRERAEERKRQERMEAAMLKIAEGRGSSRKAEGD